MIQKYIYTGDGLKEMRNMLLSELTEISFEANVNKLYINVFKTKLVLIGKNN